MVLLVDYSKRRADTTTASDVAPDKPTSSHRSHIVCQASKCCHPHEQRISRTTARQIQAAQQAAAQEEPDHMATLLPMRFSTGITKVPVKPGAFKRCETSELVREHRNRRPSVLTEIDGMDASNLDMSESESNHAPIVEPAKEEEEEEAPPPLMSRRERRKQQRDKDWSQPSRRTTSTTSRSNSSTTLKKKRPDLSRSASASQMKLNLENSFHITDGDFPKDTKQNERGCQSLSNLHEKDKDRLSFTLRRRGKPSRPLDDSISSACRLGLEQSLSKLGGSDHSSSSLAVTHSHLKSHNTGSYHSRSMLPRRSWSLQSSSTTKVSSTRGGAVSVSGRSRQHKQPPRSRSLSQSRSLCRGRTNTGDPEERSSIPTKITLGGKSSKRGKSKRPKGVSVSLLSRAEKTMGVEELEAPPEPDATILQETLEDSLSWDELSMAEDDGMLLPTRTSNTSAKGVVRTQITTIPRSRAIQRNDRMPSTEELGYGETTVVTALPPPIIIRLDNHHNDNSNDNHRFCSTQALPGYVSDEDSIGTASDLELDHKDDTESETDSVECSYATPYHSQHKQQSRSSSMGHGYHHNHIKRRASMGHNHQGQLFCGELA